MNEKNGLQGCGECRGVVLRAYEELRQKGVAEENALRAAYRLLSLRHPDRTPGTVAATVSAWISGKHAD